MADSHIACRAHAVPLSRRAHAVPLSCRAHAVPLPRRSLIHTCHAAPLPCSDSAVSFVKVRTVVQQFNRSSVL